LMQEPWD